MTTVSGTGTVIFVNIEGGFWALHGDDNRKYDPMNLPDEFKEQNLPVRFAGKLRRDMLGIHMMGTIIELTSIERR